MACAARHQSPSFAGAKASPRACITLWSKEFPEAGKRRLAGDTARAATTDEVKQLRREAQDLKEVVAEQALESRLLKKRMARPLRKWFRHDNLISLHQRIRSRGASPAKMEIRASWA